MIQAPIQRSLLQRYWLAVTVLAVVLAAWYVPPVEAGIYYRDHPISCQGRSLYPHLYKALNRVCDDCYNIFRDYSIYSQCRENCFRNDLFETCMRALTLPNDTKDQNRKQASFILESKN